VRWYELYAHKGDGLIRWPVTIGCFESRDLAERYAAMVREQRGTVYEVREANMMDRLARRELLAWEREKETHTEREQG